MIDLPQVQREALELAYNDCVGDYGLEHILALRELAKMGLARHIESADGLHAYYAITKAGRLVRLQHSLGWVNPRHRKEASQMLGDMAGEVLPQSEIAE